MASEALMDYGSFSAAVDAVESRAGRQPLRSEIASMVRQVYRTNQVAANFVQDRSEVTVEATSNPYRWIIPANFRTIEAARVMNRFGPRNEFLYFKKAPPGSLRSARQVVGGVDRIYYRGGNVVVFSGIRPGEMLGISYFSYLPPLHDYGRDALQRPWRYDIESQTWINQTQTFPLLENGESDPRSTAPLESCTNWMLFHWFELVIRGALSAILNSTNDERGPKIFAEYTALQSALRRGELE